MMTESNENSMKQQIRAARARFVAMAATYFAGVFNDNFFRQSCLLLVVAAAKEELQGVATVVFTAPFILFAAWAGWCADRFVKRRIVIASKLLELSAMLIAAVGILWFSWPLMMVTLAVMALQSTLFGPAMNGTIPELYPAEYVTTANAIVRMCSTIAILSGTAVAGVALDAVGQKAGIPSGRIIVAAGLVAMAIIGVLVSLGVPKFPAAAPHKKFPWIGPVQSLIDLWQTRRDSLLAISIAAKAFFWFFGSLQLMTLNPLGLDQFALSNKVTSGLIVIELMGIAVGGLLAAKLAKGKRWYRVLVPSALVIAACMFAVWAVPLLKLHSGRALLLIAALAITGMAGGVFSIPLAACIQVRPHKDERGKIIAVSSFLDFCGILLSGPLFYGMAKIGLQPSECFAVMGFMTWGVALALWLSLKTRKQHD